jgi:hypothetical protein
MQTFVIKYGVDLNEFPDLSQRTWSFFSAMKVLEGQTEGRVIMRSTMTDPSQRTMDVWCDTTAEDYGTAYNMTRQLVLDVLDAHSSWDLNEAWGCNQ